MRGVRQALKDREMAASEGCVILRQRQQDKTIRDLSPSLGNGSGLLDPAVRLRNVAKGQINTDRIARENSELNDGCKIGALPRKAKK